MRATWPSVPVLATAFPVSPFLADFHRGTAKNYHPTTTGLQQEPTPQSPLLEIAPPFPPHSILPQSYHKGTCSFNRPQCSSLNRIGASVEYVNSQLQSHKKCASQFLWPHAEETRPGDTWTYLSVTIFLNPNPSQNMSSHQKQDSQITTDKLSHFWLQL